MFTKILKGLSAYKLWTKGYDIVTKWEDHVGETTVNGVPVKSAWLSKINWTQVITLLIGVAAFFGYKISEADQATILGAIMSVSAAVTIIFRTFFNKTVTPGSGQ